MVSVRRSPENRLPWNVSPTFTRALSSNLISLPAGPSRDANGSRAETFHGRRPVIAVTFALLMVVTYVPIVSMGLVEFFYR